MATKTNSATPWPEEIMEKYRWPDEYLQNQAATEKQFQSAWQAYKYMQRDKMYAYTGINDQNGRTIITLKLEPMYSDILRREYKDIVSGYYVNKLHWSTVYLDGTVAQKVLADMVYASHKLILSSLSKKHSGRYWASRDIKVLVLMCTQMGGSLYGDKSH